MAESNSNEPRPCPPELAGIAAQFERLAGQPAARAALAGALYNAMAGVLLLTAQQQTAEPPEHKPPLTSEQQAVIDYLRENGVTPAEELSKQIGYSAQTIRRWCGKDGCLHSFGVITTPNGYGLKHNGQRILP